MTTYSVGDRVVLPKRSNLETWNEYEDDVTRGEVKAIPEEGKFTVKWDSSWIKPNPGTYNANELMPEAEANEILARLESEYEAWAGPIREKMKQAGQLLKEAGELADAQKKSLTEMHDIMSPLLGAMDSLGWSTSSLSC